MSECLASQCTDCGSLDVVTDLSAGDVVCRACGMILGERIIDDTPEWRTFANDDRSGDAAAKNRVGDVADQRLDDVSLSTYLVDTKQPKTSIGDGAGAGRTHKRPNISSDCAKVKRMKRLMDRVHEVAEAMTLPKSIIEVALDIYAEAERQSISMRGPEAESMPIACLFIACRKQSHPRSLKEFAEATGVPKNRIGKSFLTLSKLLTIETVQPTTESYVQRFCSRLGLPFKTQQVAFDVAKRAEGLGLATGKSPIAVAASVIYLVAAYTDVKRTLEEISDVTMIGAKNVKVVCKELNKSRVDLFAGVLMT